MTMEKYFYVPPPPGVMFVYLFQIEQKRQKTDNNASGYV